ncbi:MAG: NADH:ubiquinone reductase (Na(+)-transporting) subunit F [Brumimicrobium sp.]|nr:NADH:ubiquinone reductase (Na(+)-transporting) subunit F [Brumimicrobium sp.]MCO5268149.1 NADH:ubiquinone reductase (Na(+)-transporting) subunit F [Brumimicrobium sp.]
MGFAIIVTVIVFLLAMLVLVSMLLYVKAKVAPEGKMKITINDDKVLEVDGGDSLLTTLANQKVFLASACGGQGTCGECKCVVLEGGGSILPTEEPHFSRKEIAGNLRLSCQVKVKQDMKIVVPEAVMGVKEWEAKVVSNYNVASFIKEFVVEIPEDMNYRAGGYIQIRVPACTIDFKTMDITAHPQEHPGEPDKFHEEWDKFKLWPLQMVNTEDAIRAYSMASYPAEGRRIMLNVRIATPPFDRKTNDWMKVNPGIASSYIFNLKPGDPAIVSGPYGEFFIKEDSDAEMLYIGGGAGMAPMRSHLYHLFKTLKSGRKVTFWYGGRSRRELFYIDHFRELEKEFPNFKYFIVLSEPRPEDNWTTKTDVNDPNGDGFLGFVHQAVIDQYLSKHEAPEDIEFYFCGPPMMNNAVVKMCDDWGVPKENVSFDDFGG